MKLTELLILKYIRLCLCTLLCLAAALHASAQTDVQLSQYYEAPSYYNSAALGQTDSLRFRAGGRLQWVGIDKAPASLVATADMPFKFGKQRFGVGAFVVGEQAGLFSSLNACAQVAVKRKKFGGEFALGITVGMYDQKFEGSEVFIPDNDDYHDSNDDAIPNRDVHGTALDLGVGIWYRHPKFWAGLSCTHITEPTVTLKSENSSGSNDPYIYEFQADRALYLMGGCNIPLKNTLFVLMPSLLVKSNLTFTTGEANLRARYNGFMIFGVGYRWQDAVSLTVAAELKDFYVGYTYEYATSAVAKASWGSHEVFLGYSMKIDLSDKNKNKHKSIRIM